MKKKHFFTPEEKICSELKKDKITKLCVGVIIFNQGKLLLVRRVADDFLGGYYEIPGAGVDNKEPIERTIQRETLEETSLQVSEIVGMQKGFDYSVDGNTVRQINFVVNVVSFEVKLNPIEHDAFVWVDKNNYKEFKMTKKMQENIRSILKKSIFAL